jgi:PTS system ascorbate-specific IIB component
MKILAVCGFGVGTSLILRMNLEKVLKENQLEADVEHIDMTSAVGMQTDLVVTSREIAGEIQAGFHVPVIVIDNFMDLKEIKEKCVEVVRSMQN